MHARLTTAVAQPGKVDEIVSIFRDSIVPAEKQQKGFKGGFMLIDRNTGKGINISLWETEADMMAGEASGWLDEQRANVAPLLADTPTREHYEVMVQA